MRIEWDTPVDILMHSATIDYVDLDEDEIMHWKYIKKEKRPNGKWRYYYDTDQLKDDLGYDERDRMNKANAEYQALTADANKFKEHVTKQYYELGTQDPYSEYRYYSEKEYKYLSKLSATEADKLKKAEEAGRKAAKATSDFYNTPLGKLTKVEKKVKNGLKAVGKFFSKLFGK